RRGGFALAVCLFTLVAGAVASASGHTRRVDQASSSSVRPTTQRALLPYDLARPFETDVNGFPLNPYWAGQAGKNGSPPNPGLCGNPFGPSCTHEAVWQDVNHWKCGAGRF